MFEREKFFEYLSQLFDQGFYGKIIIGCQNGKVTSVKLDVSVDLDLFRVKDDESDQS